MKPAPCLAYLNPLGPGDACPSCTHRVLAHDLEQVCAACWVLSEGGIPAERPATGTAPSSTDPPISTR